MGAELAPLQKQADWQAFLQAKIKKDNELRDAIGAHAGQANSSDDIRPTVDTTMMGVPDLAGELDRANAKDHYRAKAELNVTAIYQATRALLVHRGQYDEVEQLDKEYKDGKASRRFWNLLTDVAGPGGLFDHPMVPAGTVAGAVEFKANDAAMLNARDPNLSAARR